MEIRLQFQNGGPIESAVFSACRGLYQHMSAELLKPKQSDTGRKLGTNGLGSVRSNLKAKSGSGNRVWLRSTPRQCRGANVGPSMLKSDPLESP